MNILEIIEKKQEGKELTRDQINFFINHYTSGIIPDYQASALLMAIFIKGMTANETAYLTEAMINSGDRIDLSDIKGVKVDKHSTGGVGDTTTLVLAPLVASCGVPFVKMSGRGLGHTGGTLDKLESIPGFKVDLNIEEIHNQVENIGVAISSQTKKITPADGKLYALRDVTATVNSPALIASSIMSKKIAMGNDAILLDVKVGSGAFMKDIARAKNLAKMMVSIGKHFNRETKAIITDMNQPLGLAVGNSLEIVEAIDVLNNKGPSDLREICIVLATHMLLLAKPNLTVDQARDLLVDSLASGKALSKFKELVKAQYGDVSYIDDPSKFKLSKFQKKIYADKTGFIKDLDALGIGRLAFMLGAGRETKESRVDLGAGVLLNCKVGSYVNKGDQLATIYTDRESILDEAVKSFNSSISYDETRPDTIQLIKAVIDNKDGVES